MGSHPTMLSTSDPPVYRSHHRAPEVGLGILRGGSACRHGGWYVSILAPGACRGLCMLGEAALHEEPRPAPVWPQQA